MHLSVSRPGALPLPRLGLSAYGTGVLYVLGAGIAFGTLGPVSNVAYGAGMGSPTFAALRATIGALVVMAIARRDERNIDLRTLSRREWGLLAMTAGAQACLSLALFAAYGAMSVALVLAVYFSYPLLVCAASIALGRERLTPTRAIALLFSLAGLLVVVLGRTSGSVHASGTGLLLAAIAACCQATYLVVSRNGFTRVPSTQAVTLILTGAAIGIWAVALPVDGGAGRLFAWVDDPAAWLAALFAGAVGAGLAKVWLLRGVRRVGGTRSSVLMLVEPVTGVALAAIVLSQPFGLPELLGGAGILVGAMLAQRPAAGPQLAGASSARRGSAAPASSAAASSSASTSSSAAASSAASSSAESSSAESSSAAASSAASSSAAASCATSASSAASRSRADS
jgi:drug/metabolite transporter, DME family